MHDALYGSQNVFALAYITVKTLAKEYLLDMICRNNLNSAFTTYAFVDGNKTVQFIVVGKAWDMMQSSLSSRVKNTFVENAANFGAASSSKVLEDPLKLYINLQGFFSDCKIKLIDSLEELRNSTKLDKSQKQAIFNEIKRSAFCNPPDQNVYAGKGNLAENIELSFYLRMVMDTDYEVRMVDNECPSSCHGQAASRVSINVPTTSAQYPRGGFMANSHPEYETIGSVIVDRINYLYKKFDKNHHGLLDPSMISSRTSFAIVQNAEKTQAKLGKHYSVERYLTAM